MHKGTFASHLDLRRHAVCPVRYRFLFRYVPFLTCPKNIQVGGVSMFGREGVSNCNCVQTTVGRQYVSGNVYGQLLFGYLQILLTLPNQIF